MKQTVEFHDFSLGLNEHVYDNLIDDRELNDVQNAVLGNGYIRKRNGYGAIGYVTGKLRATYSYIKSTGEMGYLVLGNQLAWWTGNMFSNLAGLTLDEESADHASFVTMKDRPGVSTVLIGNHRSLYEWKEGQSNLQLVQEYKPKDTEQNNPGLNDFNRLYKVRHMTLYAGRLFMAAHPTMKHRVSFPHIDPTLGRAVYDYFPAVNFFDLGEEDEIVGLVPFRSSLIIFCRHSVWALFGEVKYDFKLMKLNTSSGCIAPKSIKVVENTIFYLGDSHVYALFSNDFNMLDTQIVSTQVRQTLTDLSESEKQKAAGVFHDNKYYLSFPNGTTLVYDNLLKAWTRFTNVQANAFLVMGKDLVFGGNHNRMFRFHDGYFDVDKPILFQIQSKRFDFGTMMDEKKLRRVWMKTNQAGGYRVKCLLDQKDKLFSIPDEKLEAAQWDSGKWDESRFYKNNIYIKRIRTAERTKQLCLHIEDDSPRPFTLYSVGLEYDVKRRKEE